MLNPEAWMGTGIYSISHAGRNVIFPALGE
nr:MAG TPA: Protein of unknown function (DUF3110) [Caudoviricetes sp.]